MMIRRNKQQSISIQSNLMAMIRSKTGSTTRSTTTRTDPTAQYRRIPVGCGTAFRHDWNHTLVVDDWNNPLMTTTRRCNTSNFRE